MRKKREQLIITFSTTTEAMRMEKFCQGQDLPGRIIPLPSEISAGCGLAWKTDPDQKPVFFRKITTGRNRVGFHDCFKDLKSDSQGVFQN